MAKNIAEKAVDSESSPKQVTIKHLRTFKNAAGADVEVVDWEHTKNVDEAISQAEKELAVVPLLPNSTLISFILICPEEVRAILPLYFFVFNNICFKFSHSCFCIY